MYYEKMLHKHGVKDISKKIQVITIPAKVSLSFTAFYYVFFAITFYAGSSGVEHFNFFSCN